MAFKEIKDTHSSKFPEAAFTAKLIELGIKDVGKNPPKPEVTMTFEGAEEPTELTLRGLEKLSNGEVSDFFQLGKFIKSLRAQGIKPLIDEENRLFKTDPSIIGKTLSMKPVNERKVTDANGEKTYRDWVIEKIEGSTSSSGSAPAPTTATPELRDTWETFLIENLKEPLNITGIHKLMTAKITDAKVRAPLAAVRNQVLADVLKDGFKKYPDKLMEIDDKGLYSIVG